MKSLLSYSIFFFIIFSAYFILPITMSLLLGAEWFNIAIVYGVNVFILTAMSYKQGNEAAGWFLFLAFLLLFQLWFLSQYF